MRHKNLEIAENLRSRAFYRLGLVFTLCLATACFPPPTQSPQSSQASHAAVGRWVANAGSHVLVLTQDGKGAFDSRKCTWAIVDEATVQTECERMAIDPAIRTFVIRGEGEAATGALENFDGMTFVRRELSEVAGRGGGQEENASPGIVRWVEQGSAIHAESGRVLISVLSAGPSIGTFRISSPDGQIIALSEMPVASRRIVDVDGTEYFFDYLEYERYRRKARIAFIRRGP